MCVCVCVCGMGRGLGIKSGSEGGGFENFSKINNRGGERLFGTLE